MVDDADYHERRETQERAMAAMLPEGSARDRHLALADRHADRAWLIRSGHAARPDEIAALHNAPSYTAEHSIARAIAQSRELLAQSHRLLASSRKDVPPDR